MPFPPTTLAKYLARLDELVKEGEAIPYQTKVIHSRGSFISGERPQRRIKEADPKTFAEWRTKCITIVDLLVPAGSPNRDVVQRMPKFSNDEASVTFTLAFLRSTRSDLAGGFLDGLSTQIEIELAGDYMRQARDLLSGHGETAQGPAVVLAGAVLERALRTHCSSLDPAEPIDKPNGERLGLSALVDALKRRGVLNELTAKQLRAWAAIRNAAAHGNFEEYTHAQAEALVVGVTRFLHDFR